MSSSLSITTVANTKTTRKVTRKSTQSHNIDETLSIDISNSIRDGLSGITKDKSSSPPKPSKKKSSAATSASVSAVSTTTKATFVENSEQKIQAQEQQSNASKPEEGADIDKKKLKSKRSKKGEKDQQNISVKTSFSKFDALQKRNLIHVRSSDAGKAHEKFSNPQGDKEINCRLCSKPVYKMEEIKAEKSIYHKNCFRCHECNKQLKVDNYQSHEGILYCMVHFKLLFSPKCVEDTEPESQRKPELIVRENQPIESPPDVVRASDKPDLGLEELQQLNVRSRFQVFENGTQVQEDKSNEELHRNPVKHSNSILSKIAKLKAQGVSSDLSIKAMSERERDGASDYSSESNSDASDAEVDENSNEDDDADLVRSKKRTQRERPVGLGHAMHDIKNIFEKGHIMSKEERREERKQEIQNIRSRLFMGKQARIKEMYQQAVAESEQRITSSDKKPEIEVEGAARSLKERFERGDVFKDSADNSEENSCNHSGLQNEADVFESAISKKSRSIFMELDANVAAGRKEFNKPILPNRQLSKQYSLNTKRQNIENEPEDVVKYDEKPEDIKIETSEISSKFKFFETYCPTEQKKKEFRITPPREGVVKMPTPESDAENMEYPNELGAETNVLEKSHTTTTMLNKFREMEQNRNGKQDGPRPLKCFTPPPDGGNRIYQDADSDMGSQDDNEEFEDEDDEDDDEDYNSSSERYKRSLDDEALKEAQAAARAKQLRARFEKWEANERERELHEGRVDIYSTEVSDNSNIESTKTIRERFENMKSSTENAQTRPRYKVNRFV
ncbi:PREDICTED: LIM domain and actin-binding protein 1 isoform X2 [Rhagoletis zephyria]|uniref:LIM domain and actin-binding protein 1 isoform X2 n=1 Tax=Rhagoletis zephyria TaxID=28612 RepID=UPI00081166FC|nr:PREDICTED: LIM domain and actin-binding protein 1 isoform X2 [Rhagoletis zephyria]